MATELGKAYVQIIPSAKGIKGKMEESISPEVSEAGRSSGSLLGKTLAVSALGMAAGQLKMLGSVARASISEGANLEQTIGGIETLFGTSADLMRSYAQDAFRTAGVSANEYMNQVTSFSASLIGSLNGNTAEAARQSDQIMRAMADNSNKMGTDIQAIQNAYQGFAKGNYTMLDNLKLGYGGTRGEMERLLAKANEYNAKNGKHTNYQIDNFSDIASAIKVIQDELKITGATEVEATTTFSGSMGMMKASYSDFLGALSTGGDIKTPLQNMMTSARAFSQQALRMIQNVLRQLPGAIRELVPMLVPLITELLGSLRTTLQENLPELLQAGVTLLEGLIQGVSEALPMLVDTFINLAMTALTTLVDNLPKFIDMGLNLLMSLVDGVLDNLPKLIDAAIRAITGFIDGIVSRLPDIIQKGIELIVKLGVGIVKAIPKLVQQLPKIWDSIKTSFKNVKWGELGKSLLEGLWNGILSLGKWLWDMISSFFGWIFDKIKAFFGINSPSRLMRDEIGRFLPMGIAVGVDDEKDVVQDSLTRIADDLYFDPKLDAVTGFSFGVEDGVPSTQSALTRPMSVTVNNYSPEALTERESARQTKLAMQRLAYSF